MKTYECLAAYFERVAVALEQTGNALLGGSPDETLSSRAWRAWRDGKLFGRFFRPLIDGLFFWQADHCFHSYEAEVQRRQLPKNFK